MIPETVWFILEDADGDRARLEFDIIFLDAVPVGFLDQVAETVWSVVYALTGCTLVNAGVTHRVDITTWITVLPADTLSDVQEQSEISFKSQAGNYRFYFFPAFREEFFYGGGASKLVDISASAMALFIALQTTGFEFEVDPDLPLARVRFTDSRGSLLTELHKADEHWGKRHSARKRNPFTGQ